MMRGILARRCSRTLALLPDDEITTLEEGEGNRNFVEAKSSILHSYWLGITKYYHAMFSIPRNSDALLNNIGLRIISDLRVIAQERIPCTIFYTEYQGAPRI